MGNLVFEAPLGGSTTISGPDTTGSNTITIPNASGEFLISAGTLSASSAVATNSSGALITVANTGTGNNVLATSPTLVTPNLGTPSVLVGTNITGTAAGLTVGTATNATTATTSTNLAGGATGSVPYQSGSGATTFLPVGTNGQVLTLAAGVPTWSTVSGTGDVVGPASATANAIAIYNGATGKLIQNSGATISAGVITATGFSGPLTGTASSATNIAGGATGSVPYQTSAGVTTLLAAGSNGQVLTLSGGVPTWSSVGGTGDVVGPSSATDNALTRFDTTTGKLIQNSVVTLNDTGNMAGVVTIGTPNTISFNTSYATALTAGQLGWDGNNTLGLGMAGGNVTQHIGEDQFFYCKASSAITKGQVVMFTGSVGASGVPTGAPATGIADGTYIMGIAAESIALNNFGLVQAFGTLRNVNTSGYADGEILWYNPAVTGGLTATKPSAPNVKVQMAAVINGGSSGGGVILIRINPGSQLGGTDSNAQIGTPVNGQVITYDNSNGYWKNTTIASGTGISVSAATDGTLTITNTSPSSGGTVTSVTGTAPVVSSGGTTPAISMAAANGSTNGYLTSTDWTTFNSKQPAGTYVTSVSATSPVTSSGGTTPTIAMPAATGSVSGYLTSTDWTTFNSKGSGTVTSVGGTGTVNGLTLTGTVTSSGNLTLGGTLDLSSPPAIGGTAPAAGTFTVAKATEYIEKSTAIAASAIDLSAGNYFTKTISGTTTFTISNAAASGLVNSFILQLTNGGSATVNWFSGVKWAGGTAPTLTSSGVDVLGFYTIDGGTTWESFTLGKNMS